MSEVDFNLLQKAGAPFSRLTANEFECLLEDEIKSINSDLEIIFVHKSRILRLLEQARSRFAAKKVDKH